MGNLKLRKLAPVLIASLLLGSVATASVLAQGSPSQTVLSGKVKVSPNRAGTRHHPRGVRLTVTTHWRTPPQFERPIVQKGVVLFPKGSLYNGGKYPRCSISRADRSGPGACPKGSIMGTGTGNAFADTVLTHPQITVINAGPKAVCLYTVLNNPARVQTCVPGAIKRLHGKWAYRLTLTVPQELQVVAGVPIQLTDLTIRAGRGKWLATTGCNHHRWPFSVTTSYDNGGSSTLRSSTPCRG